MSSRYGSFTVRTDCRHCGQPIPLNGPLQRVHCNHCQNDVDLPDAIWPHVLGHFDEVHDTLSEGIGSAKTRDVLGFTVHYEYARAHPPSSATSYPAPEWLRGVVPNATEVISTEPVAGPAQRVAAEPPQEAVKPVVMTCPQCGAALRLTAESERTTTCQFCKTDVYLPDDLWRRLHPAKVVRPWYVRFDGKTQTQRRAEMEAAQAERDRAAKIERAARAEENVRTRDAEVLRLKRTAYGWIAVLYALMALTLACIGLSLATDVLGGAEPAACIAMTAATAVAVLVTVYMGSRPVKLRTGYDGAAMMFVAWFYLIFGFAMPIVGQVMVLVMGIKRFTGTLGGVTITEGGSSTTYPKIELTQGETFPLGLAYVAFALWWPAAVVGTAMVVSQGGLVHAFSAL